MTDDRIFHRVHLAKQLGQLILAKAIGSSVSSGLFLAAPRRTGKSTFLREDLRPGLLQPRVRERLQRAAEQDGELALVPLHDVEGG